MTTPTATTDRRRRPGAGHGNLNETTTAASVQGRRRLRRHRHVALPGLRRVRLVHHGHRDDDGVHRRSDADAHAGDPTPRRHQPTDRHADRPTLPPAPTIPPLPTLGRADAAIAAALLADAERRVPTPTPTSTASSASSADSTAVDPRRRVRRSPGGPVGPGGSARPIRDPARAPPPPVRSRASPPIDRSSSRRVDAQLAFDTGACRVRQLRVGRPALVLTVPGILIVIAVLVQTLIGLAWLPVARRWLGGDRRRAPCRARRARLESRASSGAGGFLRGARSSWPARSGHS